MLGERRPGLPLQRHRRPIESGGHATKSTADYLFDYLRNAIYDPAHATLDVEKLPEDFHDLGRGLRYFVECSLEAKALALALSKGDLHGALPSPGNEIAASLKALHATLKHLTWQTQQVARGNYSQRVEFMGDFASAFNGMVEQLDEQRTALIEARFDAEAANQAKGRFLAMISHEMRTPLNAIIGLSEIQLQNDLPEEVAGDLEKIYNAGSGLLAIINDMLDFSRIEAGSFELTSIEYNVPSLLNDTVQLNIVRIGSKPITFELEVDETLPASLCGDELRIKQILNNLLSNAFKYTKEGRVSMTASWERDEGSAWLSFAVSDTGIGIREEEMDKLFSEYAKLDSKTNRKIEGTGLGLSITKKLVEMMGGEISVKSEYGKGSTFLVRIRQDIADDCPIGPEVALNLKSFRFKGDRRLRGKNLVRAYMPYGRVLVVDDVATNLDVAKGLLSLYGLTVDCVRSGQEAIDKIRSGTEQYDIVFMDHMMPDMDGVETTRIIRYEIGTEYAKSVPIVAMTANAIMGSEELFLLQGFNAFLPKPVDLMSLDTLLNRWIRDKQDEETLRDAEAKGGVPAVPPVWTRGRSGGEPEGEIDFETGVARYGNEETYLGILRSYAKHTPTLLATLRQVSEETLPQYVVAIHGLKGSSFGAALERAGKRAESLERAARGGNIETVRTETPAFLAFEERLLGDIEALLQRKTRQEEKERRPAPDGVLLVGLLEACRHFRLNGMEEALAELERYDYESRATLIPWLREQLDNLEYEAIQNHLEAELASEGSNGDTPSFS